LYNLLSFKGCNSAGPDSEFRVRGGTQALPLAIAAKLGPSRLTLGDPVKSVRVIKENEVHVQTRSGRLFVAKTVILTGSPPAMLGISFDPPLPTVHAQLLQRMPMGTSRKFIAVYKRGPWWRSFGLTGDILASTLPEDLSIPVGSDMVPIFGQCFDTSPFSQRYGVLTCFVEGRQNLYFSRLDEEQQRDIFRKFLWVTFKDVLNEPDATLWEPDWFVSHDWAADNYVRGAYTAYFPPGILSVSEWWEAYREMEKIPNVFLAGSDYQVGFGSGYMEGAIRAGERAAVMVKQRLTELQADDRIAD
jgi:monoamine oxidase